MSELEKVVEELEEVEPVENEYSPAEEKAMSSGWRPEEEWSGDSEDWIDARTFNRNGEFMSRIQHQSKELTSLREESESLKAGMKELGEHNKKIAEQEFKKAMAALKREKVLALEEDDHVSVVDIDDRIGDLKESKKYMDEAEILEKPPENIAPNPVFVDWASINQWYSNDALLRGAADSVGMEYADKNPGAPIEDVLSFVTNRMKEEFPNKFGNTKRGEPSSVTEGVKATRKSKKAKYTVKDLNDEQKQFGKMFVDTGAFDDIQEYVDSLAKSGEL